MIDIVRKERIPPPEGVRVGIFDEVQDFTPMQIDLIRFWRDKHLEHIMLAGDDDQCQPPGIIVETTTGGVPIEDLDEWRDRVLAYSRSDATVYGKREGFAFKKAVRTFEGDMFTVKLDAEGLPETRATPNHIWLAKWKESAKDLHCTYIMRKGAKFRVGWCKLIRSDGIFHLGCRAHLEEADEAWVVETHHTATDASLYESYLAAVYGIPTVMFKESPGSNHYAQEALDELFWKIMTVRNLKVSAELLLDDHKRNIKYPLWSAEEARTRRGGCSILKVRTCNLLPHAMLLPAWSKVRSPAAYWSAFELDVNHYRGPVYSLDVEKYHTYIADGIITHNCIYSFTGATADVMLEAKIPEKNKTFLEQSYRVPEVVCKLADGWVRKLSKRQEKTLKPRLVNNVPVKGSIEEVPCAYSQADKLLHYIENLLSTTPKHQTIMILGSCNYMLSGIVAKMRDAGIPFGNRYRRSNGAWNPLHPSRGTSSAKRLYNYLTPMGPDDWMGSSVWTPQQLWMWLEMCETKGLLKTGGKKVFMSFAKEKEFSSTQLVNLMMEHFEPQALDASLELSPKWLWSKLLKDKAKVLHYPMAILERYGKEPLVNEPRVLVGTVHSVKGGQADHVILFPDMSLNAAQSCQHQEGKDSVFTSV